LVIGPAISVLGFVCSIGNVSLAWVLWNVGMGFGGVVAFIFADLISSGSWSSPGGTTAPDDDAHLPRAFYGAMVLAGYATDFLFGCLGLVRRLGRKGGGGSRQLELHDPYSTSFSCCRQRRFRCCSPVPVRCPILKDDGRQPGRA
jgi:hypothetical protein